MTTAGRRQTAAEKIRDAESARDELADALKAAGVSLPSLGLDGPSCTGPDPLALIELGRCNIATARALAAALRANGATGAER
ncbi:hypothetical protein [Streptomyces aidingensis]|uniref:Uncharacterized protein n=1 Tax=Streptomyces aidingensis TaxID=910347 RepID=A0A1I1K9Y9_9ACTN|nr:hypothetical protein [Streptomyces aidingensis]SFC55518.1 hypothetical protein SAMN05421773_10476 [Streptomyces aidingensis]